MPQAAQKSRRTPQCAYSEGGRKCRRSTTDASGLCGPHKIAVAEQVRAQQQRAGAAVASGAGVTELLDRLLNRKRVSRAVLEDALSDVTAFYEQYRAQQSAERPPNYVPPNTADERRARGGHAWWDGIADQVRRAQQPPVDPRVAELKARRARARAALGLDQTSTITADQLRDLRRKLSRIHHPDRGGTAAKMAEINDAIDVLEQSLVQPL